MTINFSRWSYCSVLFLHVDRSLVLFSHSVTRMPSISVWRPLFSSVCKFSLDWPGVSILVYRWMDVCSPPHTPLEFRSRLHVMTVSASAHSPRLGWLVRNMTDGMPCSSEYYLTAPVVERKENRRGKMRIYGFEALSACPKPIFSFFVSSHSFASMLFNLHWITSSRAQSSTSHSKQRTYK